MKNNDLNTWKWSLVGALLTFYLFVATYYNYDRVINSVGHDSSKGAYNSLMKLLDTLGGKNAVYGLLIITFIYFIIDAFFRYKRAKKIKNDKKQKR